MPTLFKNGIVSKDGVNQGVSIPSSQSQSRNTASPQASVSNLLGSAANFGSSVVGQIGAGIKDIAEDVFNADNFMSLIRGRGLPGFGMPDNFLGFADVSWKGADDDDWRVKLSMPSNFRLDGPLQQKLLTTNGMLFPFTPQVILSHSASYNQVRPTHSNYPFPAYQSSAPDTIQVVGDFICEDIEEATYWVAAMHYLRAVTKMSYGKSEFQGSPPPVVALNGYGDYVFKNVPVVVINFTVDMPVDVDYIHVPAPVNTWVPTRSSVAVQLQTAYARRSVQQFNLQKFVNGGYAKGNGGFI